MIISIAKIDLMFVSKMMFLRRWRGSSISNYRRGSRSTEPHPYIYINNIFKIFNTINFYNIISFTIIFIIISPSLIFIHHIFIIFFNTSISFSTIIFIIFTFTYNLIFIITFSIIVITAYLYYNTNSIYSALILNKR